MATISIFLSDLVGVSGMYLWLRKESDFSLVNTGGDVLTDAGGIGVFAASVAEDLSAVGLCHVTISSDGTEANAIADGWLPQGATLVIEHHPHAELDSAALALINKIEASTAGTVSGAGTDTEIFVGSNVTLTITVDADGNRSAVVVS